MDEINKQPAENSARDKKSAQQTAERNPAKQQTIKRLLSYAGKSRGLLSLSLVLSGLSALVGFVPYIMVYFVMRDVIAAAIANEAVHAAALARYGLWAVGSAATGFVLYYAFARNRVYDSGKPFDSDDGNACGTSDRLEP